MATGTALALIVIRSADIEALKDFYEKIGLDFQKEQHGKGPVHYSSVSGAIVLEIYPAYAEEAPTMNRLGFYLENLEATMHRLKTDGVEILSPSAQTQRGVVAIVKDPEGRKIELYQKPA